MKVVKNDCFGGFGLSKKALKRLGELKGVASVTIEEYNIPRDDPCLIRVVEELGKEASDRFAKLVIVNVPDGVKWCVDEYDGFETIRENHRTW